ncbi:hypothetical protein DID77_03950 [Candidatus Marinamargulisbacteria bacterium SCGC AG-439-L15]|nr:hypothetical protein DID77_03950 [Candidatus Marinamargulisbacteria bacterium SCGC AG-439-L15]
MGFLDRFSGFLSDNNMEGLCHNDPSKAEFTYLPIPYHPLHQHKDKNKGLSETILSTLNTSPLFDTELQQSLDRSSLYTNPSLNINYDNIPDLFQTISQKSHEIISNNRWGLYVGGEHGILPSILQAYTKHYEIGLISLSAQLRLNHDQESRFSLNYSTMKACHRLCPNIMNLGTRRYNQEELSYAISHQLTLITDKNLYLYDYNLQTLFSAFPESVLLAIDFDFFAPETFSAVPEPIPGGPHWWPSLMLLREIFKHRYVMGVVLTGIDPQTAQKEHVYFTAALIKKCLIYFRYLSPKNVVGRVEIPLISKN